ncbi:MAG: hypothetical protein RI942_1476 [Pseudomonadota bacterium]
MLRSLRSGSIVYETGKLREWGSREPGGRHIYGVTAAGKKKGPEYTPAPLSLLRLEVVVELHCYVAWASVDGVIRDAVQCAARGQTNEGASQRDGSANYADTLIA